MVVVGIDHPGLFGSAVIAATRARHVHGERNVALPDRHPAHVGFAKRLFNGGQIPLHPGLHVVTDVVGMVTPLQSRPPWSPVSWSHSRVRTSSRAPSCTGARSSPAGRRNDRCRARRGLGRVDAWFNRRIYGGQGTPNVWHNPTDRRRSVRSRCDLDRMALVGTIVRNATSYVMSGLLAISMVFKPSFAVVFVPALFVITGIRAIGRIALRQFAGSCSR